MMKISRIFLALYLSSFLIHVFETKAFAHSTSGNIQFFSDDATEEPIDPTEPEKPIVPNQPPIAGALSLSYVSNLSFGTQAMSTRSQEYFAQPDNIMDKETNQSKEVPNFVQLTDKTGKNLGWELTVTQSRPLTNERGFMLENTRFSFRNLVLKGLLFDATAPYFPEKEINLTKVNEPVLVARATKETGQGTWSIQFGKEGNEANKSISVYIPGKVKKEAGQYNTTLIWTLTNSL
ncbi:WxL domain-containing protein [Enterococcus quebecensis]|uniref:WxL domain-containing protein n=1 Tax=Enterococcus quebecensis TaxID=903983 RepID=A0A1E5GTN5_9ENTE|nr:WxL domain-containing protein [Enterococcus quebecensis]OEG16052.1 hypothetical protein BCR23_07855 [Enterococcus quebecensis]